LGKETKDLEHPTRSRKPKASTEAEEFAKEKVTEIIIEEPATQATLHPR
jgi:hypothetical protein